MLLLYQELPNQNSIIFSSPVTERGGVRLTFSLLSMALAFDAFLVPVRAIETRCR